MLVFLLTFLVTAFVFLKSHFSFSRLFPNRLNDVGKCFVINTCQYKNKQSRGGGGGRTFGKNTSNAKTEPDVSI